MQNCEYWIVWWINFGYKNERYVYGRLVVVGLRALWPFYGLKLEVWLGLELGPKWVDNWGIVRTELKIRYFQPWKFWHFVKIADWLKQRNETLKSKTISLPHWGWNWCCCCCCCCCCFVFFFFFKLFMRACVALVSLCVKATNQAYHGQDHNPGPTKGSLGLNSALGFQA